MNRTRHPLLLGLLVPFVLAALACSKSSEITDAGPASRPLELVNVRVKDAPIELRIPKAWEVVDVKADDVPAKAAPTKDGTVPPVSLTNRLLMTVKAASGARGALAAPRMELFHDPWLPIGTSATDYLTAQRAANEAAVKGGTKEAKTLIRHVEAERSRRDGRPSYFVRDEWDLEFKNVRDTISQISLLLVETDQDGELHGYTLVATLLKKDRDALDKTLREIFDSVHFAKE
jgi:hypothetical protein